MIFANEVIVTIITSRISNSYDQRIEFMGNKESLVSVNDDIKEPISYPQRYRYSYENELHDFHSLITGEQSSEWLRDSLVQKVQSTRVH